MKIGDITFQWSYNCGSILQCMALRRVLQSLGNEVEVINFSTPEQRRLYSVFYPWSSVRNIAKNLLCMPGHAKIADHYAQYDAYIKAQFGYEEEPMASSEELRERLPCFDALVAGGDQVWNVNVQDFSTAYFLDFSDNTYKFSYSPSLGATDINLSPNAQEYSELLSKFSGISCREPNGAKRLHQLTGRDVELVLDPSLLLSAEEWRQEVNDPDVGVPSCSFIFYYAFSYSADNNAAIERLAEELDMPVIVIDAKQWYIRRLSQYKHFVLSETTGPEAFLKYMDRAAYVVTTSFHGTAFSIIFGKQFAYINLPKHDAGDDRTSFLVDELGLDDRFIMVDSLSSGMLRRTIDWRGVYVKLDRMQQLSLSYIVRNLERARDAH